MYRFVSPTTAPTKRPNLVQSVGKLAMAVEQAGFTVEEMIRLLNAGLTLETLIDLIALRLDSMGLLALDSSAKDYRV